MNGTDLLRTHLPRGRRRWLRVAAWSVVETGPVLASGLVVARAVDAGFLAGRPLTGLALLGLLAVLHLARGVAQRALFGEFADIVEPLRDGLVDHVVEATLTGAAQARSSHSAEPDAAVVARLTGQVESVRMLCGALLRVTRPVLVTVVASAVGLGLLAPPLVLVIAPALLVVAVAFPVSVRALVRSRRAMTLAEEAVAARAGSTVRAARDIAALGAGTSALAATAAAAAEYARAVTGQARAACSRVLLTTVGGRVPLVVVLALAPSMLADGRITTGELLGTVVYLTTQLVPALGAATGMVSDYWTQLGVVLGRLAETTTDEVAPAAGVVPRAPAGPVDLVADGISFAYGAGAAPVVSDLHLRVPAGDHLAIVGASGIGKSTVAALLAGVDAPDRGRVLLDGRGATVDLAALATAARRRTVTVVPQQAYVFEGTVRDNITYLAGPLADHELAAAVREVGAGPLVARLGGPDAVLTDPARELSAADRQLLVLARALLADSPVVVLDEATSHLDPDAEARAEAAFAARPGTLVVVAHRLDAARRAHRVLFLHDRDGGVHAEVGSHEELLRRSAGYRDLVAAADAPVPRATVAP